jgi:hypothetical protein
MPHRAIDLAGVQWTVSTTGRRTQYAKDEFTVLFTSRATGEQRVARYSPLGSKAREDSLAELTDDQLASLWHRSQPSWTTAELEYRR